MRHNPDPSLPIYRPTAKHGKGYSAAAERRSTGLLPLRAPGLAPFRFKMAESPRSFWLMHGNHKRSLQPPYPTPEEKRQRVGSPPRPSTRRFLRRGLPRHQRGRRQPGRPQQVAHEPNGIQLRLANGHPAPAISVTWTIRPRSCYYRLMSK